MSLSQEQAVRFYETLAMLIANRENVDIKVKVTPREENKKAAKVTTEGK